MRAGELKHRLRLETLQGSPELDSRGQPKTKWETLADRIPAKIVTLSGLELIRARQLVAQATTEVTIRYLPALANLRTTARFVMADPDGMRVDRVLNIAHVNDLENERTEMRVLCVEEKAPVVGDGE